MSLSVHNALPPGWVDRFDPSHGRIAIGYDPATTTKKKSNPSALTVVQQCGLYYYARLIVRFKTADGDVVEALINEIVTGLRARGLSVHGLAILATNERFFAVSLKKRFTGRLPVKLLIESENVTYTGTVMKVKAWIGNLVVNTITDGYLPLPPDRFVRDDLRLVAMDRGTFEAELGEDGGHGDIFVSLGAAIARLTTKGGRAEAQAVAVGTMGQRAPGSHVRHPLARRLAGRNTLRT